MLGSPFNGASPNDNFGIRTHLSADGNVFAVDEGLHSDKLHVHQFVQGEWRPKGQPILSQDQHQYRGSCMSADGNFVVLGLTPFHYDRKEDSWIPMASFPSTHPHPIEDGQNQWGSVHCSADGRIVVKTHNGSSQDPTPSVQVFRAVEG